jgi:hypothetical protein
MRGSSRGGGEKVAASEKSGDSNSRSKPIQLEATKRAAGGPGHLGDSNAHGKAANIFADFISDHKSEMEMGKPWFNNRQDELRKHVMEKSRFVRLQDHGKDIKTLADTKYSAIGHKIQMQMLINENECRKESSFVAYSKQVGASPEVVATQQLRQTLDPNAKTLLGGRKRKNIRPVE